MPRQFASLAGTLGMLLCYAMDAGQRVFCAMAWSHFWRVFSCPRSCLVLPMLCDNMRPGQSGLCPPLVSFYCCTISQIAMCQGRVPGPSVFAAAT